MADGPRVLQDDGVAETHYVYDGNNVVLELDDVGTVEADFTYVPAPYAQVLSQHRDLESSFYQFDGIHNVRQLTDDVQVVTDDYSFDAWGLGQSDQHHRQHGQFSAVERRVPCLPQRPERWPGTAVLNPPPQLQPAHRSFHLRRSGEG